MTAAESLPGTVLVVDDEGSVRSLVRRLLESDGFDVLEAADADEALRIADQQGEAIRVLLTDVLMPGRSGAELATILQTRKPALKVVFMSGYQGDARLEKALKGKHAFFIQKPFSRITLLTAVRAALVSSP